MLGLLRAIFNDGTTDIRGKVIGIYVFLIADEYHRLGLGADRLS